MRFTNKILFSLSDLFDDGEDAIERAGGVAGKTGEAIDKLAEELLGTAQEKRADVRKRIAAELLGFGDRAVEAGDAIKKSTVEFDQVLMKLEGRDPNTVSQGYEGAIDGERGPMTIAAEDDLDEANAYADEDERREELVNAFATPAGG